MSYASKIWHRQPPFPTPIDRGRDLCNGLISTLDFNNGIHDQLRGSYFLFNAAIPLGTVEARNSTIKESGVYRIPLGVAQGRLLTASTDGVVQSGKDVYYERTGSITFAAAFTVRNLLAASAFYAGCSSGNDGYWIGQHFSTGYIYGKVGNKTVDPSTVVFAAGSTYIVLVRYDKQAATNDLWVGHTKLGSNTAVTDSTFDASFCRYGMGYSTAGSNFDGVGYFTRLWDRPLADHEIHSFVDNPWQIYVKRRPRYFLGAAGATFQPAWAINANAVIQAGVTTA